MSSARIWPDPVSCVRPDSTVLEAIQMMDREKVGAVVVMNDDGLKGIFSERDVMLRVVLPLRNPETTCISDVMTSPVETVPKNTTTDDALKLMLERHIRHLPVIGGAGRVEGMLSIRTLLNQKVEDLTLELDTLEAYFTADGAGG